MAPQDRGVGSPLGPLGPPGRAKARRERYMGTSGPAGSLLGWGWVALHTALYPSITCCDFGRPAGLTVGKKAPSHGSFLKRSRLPSSHPPRPPLPLFSP